MATFPLGVVTWGPIDAKSRDAHFIEKFIEPVGVHKALDPSVWLVTGEKGAGKTAIRRALLEKAEYAKKYVAIVTIDFDDLSFNAIYKGIANGFRPSHQRSKAQCNVQPVAILAYRRAYLQGARGDRRCWTVQQRRESVRSGGRYPQHHYARAITKQIERIWDKLDEFTAPGKKHNGSKAGLIEHGGLKGKIIDEIMRFPLDERFRKLVREFGELLDRHYHHILAILDGFDRLRNDGASHDSVKLIFNSLVDVVYSLHVDSDRSDRIEIKALIPHDRYLNVSLRDSDKIDALHTRSTWDSEPFQKFLARRMELSPKLQGQSFRTLWRQVMPEHIQNPVYRLEEDSFEYVLRHTLYRPRHLQIHLEALAKETENSIVDPSIVPKIVEQSCRRLASHFLNEYQTSIDELMDTLYMMGTFGVVYFPGSPRWPTAAYGYTPPSRQSGRHYVEFFFKVPRSNVSFSLDDTTLIALHPILSDELQLKPHPDLIVG